LRNPLHAKNYARNRDDDANIVRWISPFMTSIIADESNSRVWMIHSLEMIAFVISTERRRSQSNQKISHHRAPNDEISDWITSDNERPRLLFCFLRCTHLMKIDAHLF
jgi:hypothetical protein